MISCGSPTSSHLRRRGVTPTSALTPVALYTTPRSRRHTALAAAGHRRDATGSAEAASSAQRAAVSTGGRATRRHVRDAELLQQVWIASAASWVTKAKRVVAWSEACRRICHDAVSMVGPTISDINLRVWFESSL